MSETQDVENSFEKEIEKLPPEIKSKLLAKKDKIAKVVEAINKKAEKQSMGFYITAEIEVKNNVPTPNFEKLSINFLFDDFEKPIPYFDPKLLLGNDFSKLLEEEKKKDKYNQEYFEYTLKDDKDMKFFGTSVSILRENCFDGIYDDLKKLGTSIVYEDNRGFISALKTIDIHRNMLLQKFEKYVVVYAGAGSWLRGEKSNDFDVFIVIDDTDVKRMPRLQVKDQLTKIIWQMAREVGALTGINIHIQVYLLTDFWDALKDAHPVMFTFLRDGVPFYDRGIYSAWKELLKLGKIRPSNEAIDMHMNVGTQLIDRAKKMFADIVVNEIYNSVLSPSQAILMLKGYNPTTPKETVKMFKDVLLGKEKSITKKEADTLEETVALFKKIEHDKNYQVTGTELDRLIKNSEDYLKKIKEMFEEISEGKTKESIITSYNELLNQLKALPGFQEIEEKELLPKFDMDYIKSGKLPAFTKDSVKDIIKAKQDYDKNKISATEVNKVLKEIRNLLSEIKTLRDNNILAQANRRKFSFSFGDNKQAEIFSYDNKIILVDFSSNNTFEFDGKQFNKSDIKKENLNDTSKLDNLKMSGLLLDCAKVTLKADEITL